MKTIPGAKSSLDLPGLVGSSADGSLIPRLPTVDDKVSLRLKSEFPASNAVGRALSVTSSGRLNVVDMETDWLCEVGAQVLTPVDTTASIGSLTAGDQSTVLKVSGSEVARLAFEVSPI